MTKQPESVGRRLVQAVALVTGVTMAAAGILLVLTAAGVTSVGASHQDEAEIAGAQVVAAAAAAAVDAAGPAIATRAASLRPSGPGTVSVLALAAPGEATADRSVYVYRPAVPDSADLPVVYFLHGVPGGPDDVFAAGLASYLNTAFLNGMAPFVVASPDGNGDSHDDTEWADAWNGSDRIETFLVDTVIPAVEGTHPRDGAHRAIAGDSMGGYGALNIAMRHPGVFTQVVSIAGYFHVDDPASMFDNQSDLVDANSPDQHPDAARGLQILLVDGTSESDPVIQGESQRMSQLLDDHDIPNQLVMAPGDDSYEFVASQFGAVTAFLEKGF